MKNEDIYQEWKQNRRQVSESIHISSRVMDSIHEHEQTTESEVSFDFLTEIPLIANRMMRYAAAMGLSALGFYRVYSVAGNLLMP